nr:FecR family protein [Mucilaginibacter sp. L294]
MIADRQRLLGLLAQYAKNEISPQDFEELSAYMNQPDADPVLLQALTDVNKGLALKPVSADDKDRIYQKIKNHPDFIASKYKSSKLRVLWRGVAAAAILLGIGIGYNMLKVSDHKPVVVITKAKVQEKIDMGSKMAVLTLSNGKQVLLGKSMSGLIITEAGYSVNQQQGLLKYDGTSNKDSQDDALNTITVPQGSNYQLILSDGTKVWLNTNSSITYPVAFKGKSREVSLTGEAYFEVVHNASKPFIVNNELANVTVLGTHFNVKAYPDEKMTTTLLNGSVKVSKNGGGSTTIKPDQEATVSFGQSSVRVENIDAEEAIAWKNGYFLFNNENIKEVMKTIGRWYDVDIDYQGDMTGKTFGGTIARFERVETLLKSIEMTGVIHFKKTGRRITVMP